MCKCKNERNRGMENERVRNSNRKGGFKEWKDVQI